MQIDIVYLDHLDHFQICIRDGNAPGDHVFHVERGDLETVAASLNAALACNQWDDNWEMHVKTEQKAVTIFADRPKEE